MLSSKGRRGFNGFSMVIVLAASMIAVPPVTAEENVATGLNGKKINLTGGFYDPNSEQILQEEPPILVFDGLSEKGGQQIVEGYRRAFGKDVMGDHIRAKLTELDEKIEKILLTLASSEEKKIVKKRLQKEIEDRDPAETGRILELSIIKSYREKHRIPYVSPFYY